MIIGESVVKKIKQTPHIYTVFLKQSQKVSLVLPLICKLKRVSCSPAKVNQDRIFCEFYAQIISNNQQIIPTLFEMFADYLLIIWDYLLYYLRIICWIIWDHLFDYLLINWECLLDYLRLLEDCLQVIPYYSIFLRLFENLQVIWDFLLLICQLIWDYLRLFEHSPAVDLHWSDSHDWESKIVSKLPWPPEAHRGTATPTAT